MRLCCQSELRPPTGRWVLVIMLLPIQVPERRRHLVMVVEPPDEPPRWRWRWPVVVVVRLAVALMRTVLTICCTALAAVAMVAAGDRERPSGSGDQPRDGQDRGEPRFQMDAPPRARVELAPRAQLDAIQLERVSLRASGLQPRRDRPKVLGQRIVVWCLHDPLYERRALFLTGHRRSAVARRARRPLQGGLRATQGTRDRACRTCTEWCEGGS
jgi:hypothetical protein